MLITKTDPLSGKVNSIEIPISQEQLNLCNKRHESRTPIQDIVPHLTPDQREFLMTGITPETWKKHFSTTRDRFEVK